MPTSSRFAVASHVLVAMAMREGTPLRSEDIAARARTNPTVIRRLLTMLSRAGITTSQLGLGGGSLLAREPERISLLDVYRAVEEPGLFAAPRCPPDAACPIGGNIGAVLAKHTERAEAALERELATTSVAELAREVATAGKVSEEA